MNSQKIKITYFGSYLPEKVLTNKDILTEMGSSVGEQVLYRAVGSVEKRVATKEEMNSDMVARVGKEILAKASLGVEMIDKLICSCDPQDQAAPDTAVIAQTKIGLTCPAFGVSMSCVGWICSVQIAMGFLNGGDNKILAMASSTVELKFSFASPMHRAIFGDGAGGALIEKTDGPGAEILAIDLFTVGEHYKDIYGPHPWSAVPSAIPAVFLKAFYMSPDNKVFFDAIDKHIKPFFFNILKRANLEITDIDLFVVHQASIPIFNHTVKSFGVPKEKTPVYYELMGNTISAELPIITSLEIEKKSIKKGSTVLYLTYGAGFTAGAMILKF